LLPIHPSSSFLHTPLPQPSTLFPYTTLFRSLLKSRKGPKCRVDRRRKIPLGLSPTALFHQRPEERVVPVAAAVVANGRWGRAQGDRKSTRLNSSHGSSSYAVSCLKKKKDSNP